MPNSITITEGSNASVTFTITHADNRKISKLIKGILAFMMIVLFYILGPEVNLNQMAAENLSRAGLFLNLREISAVLGDANTFARVVASAILFIVLVCDKYESVKSALASMAGYMGIVYFIASKIGHGI
jgi:hypothetical protein